MNRRHQVTLPEKFLLKVSTYFFHCSGVEFVQRRYNVRHVEPWISVFRDWMKTEKANMHEIKVGVFISSDSQIITKQFEHVAVSSFRPCNIQVQSKNKSHVSYHAIELIRCNSLSLVDAAKLHQQTIKPSILHLLQQLVFHHVGVVLQKLEMCVKACTNFWHHWKTIVISLWELHTCNQLHTLDNRFHFVWRQQVCYQVF